ncbi:MBL fold metallo-hydrolase [uncultured Dokdonia sp.]|mgnify:CR=1 FL=1|uniref:MBL fold metallo-hydrolase n=1 Tax=uncultured Dokdonia sp. TaxID=575653 RepID=UPI00262BA509|nr:MBL fold metallo-hydrolase [uncultured Dokdonia sp.]
MNKIYRPTLKVLGVGSGTTEILYGEPSSSFCILNKEKCILQVDIGFGVTRAIKKHLEIFPKTIYISHNHLDHAGELPVVSQVFKDQHSKLQILSAPKVQEKLKKHRLNEIDNGGLNIDELIDWQKIEPEQIFHINESFSIEIMQAQHSEICYGFRLSYRNKLILAYSADSGYNKAYYEWLSKAPVMILDGRIKSSKDHASFDEIAEFSSSLKEKEIYILHYGRSIDKIDNLKCLIPGQLFTL